MHRKAWMRECAQRLINKMQMETGEAAATAESLAELEGEVSGNDAQYWESPARAADLHIASIELNKGARYPVPQDPEAYNAALRTRLAAGRDPSRSLSMDEE